jgi:RND family efflux transporter MFP subunit
MNEADQAKTSPVAPDGDERTEAPRGISKWARRLLPLLVVGVAAAGFVALVKTRKPPRRVKQVQRGPLVETVEARWQRRKVEVTSNGVINPRREVTVAPQVGGKVVWVHPALAVGGTLKRGATLLRIDRQDYELAVQRAKAAVAVAELRLAEAKSNARVSRREWKRLGAREGQTPNPLTLYEPQLKSAEATLQSARADLQQAKVNLGRTVLRAPFNCRVRQKMVDRGQHVMPGQSLVRVFDTDVVEVIVSLPTDELRWLKVPEDTRREHDAPEVAVTLRTSSQRYTRWGRLVRTVGEVDPTGRMSKVVVAIDDPYNLARAADAPYTPDFEVGAFVNVTLPGKTLSRVMILPTEALRLGSVVWVVGAQQRLRVKPVTVVRRDEREVLISAGLDPGDRVVLTKINGAVEGLKLRLRPRDAQRKPVGAESAVPGKKLSMEATGR